MAKKAEVVTAGDGLSTLDIMILTSDINCDVKIAPFILIVLLLIFTVQL